MKNFCNRMMTSHIIEVPMLVIHPISYGIQRLKEIRQDTNITEGIQGIKNFQNIVEEKVSGTIDYYYRLHYRLHYGFR